MTLDRTKLIKLLMLTQSDQDGEALSAIRKANDLLKKSNKNWEEFLSPQKEEPTYYLSKTDKMFEVCLENIQGKAREFILSLQNQWTRRGSLSRKQRAALQKFYDNCV